MISLSQPRKSKERDTTVALINIVFLMLIFFLIAGTIVPPLDRAITPVDNTRENNAELEGALGVRKDGSLFANGVQVTLESYLEDMSPSSKETISPSPLRILPDKDASAVRVIDVINQIKAAGIAEIRIVTEKSSK